MTTHDYTQRYWGHDYAVTGIMEHNRIILMGWGHGLNPGDFILLESNVSGSTRYKLDKVTYCADPRDMWRAEATFAPRTFAP